MGSDFSQIDCKCELSFQIKLFCVHEYIKYIWRNVQVIRLDLVVPCCGLVLVNGTCTIQYVPTVGEQLW